ncbi:MAG: epimerase, partial [Pseudomonadota bacterium]
AEYIFDRLNMPMRVRHVPVALLDVIARSLGVLGRAIPPLADKAEFARIGRYYATQSMLVWDEERGQYSSEKTPSTGRETLYHYYDQLLAGEAKVDLGEHAVF